MPWLFLSLLLAIAVSAILYLLSIRLRAAVDNQRVSRQSNSSENREEDRVVSISTCKKGENYCVKEEGERKCINAGKQQTKTTKPGESEEYWASDESSQCSNDNESLVAKKPRGKRCSQTRHGNTTSTDTSSSSDCQSSKKPSPCLRKQEQKFPTVPFSNDEQGISGEKSLQGKPVNYSGDEKHKSSGSESFIPVKDCTPHVSLITQLIKY